jgi:hypothetical protein
MSQVAAGAEKVDPLRHQLDELDLLMERMLALGVQSPPTGPTPESIQQPHVAPVSTERHVAQAVESAQAGEAPFSSVDQGVLPVEAPYVAGPGTTPSESDTGVTVEQETGLELEPGLELAPSAPTFVSLDAGSGGPPAPLFAEFQFAPLPSVPAIEPELLVNPDPGAAAPAPFADFQFAPPPSMPALEPAPASVVPRTSAPMKPVVIVAWWLQPLGLVDRIYDGSTSWLGPIGRGLRSRPMRNFLGICGLACMLGALAWVLWEGTDWNS